MKTKLGDMKDQEIFRAIKQLEGKRVIPPIRKEDNTEAFEHEEISDLIAKQLYLSEKHEDDYTNCAK